MTTASAPTAGVPSLVFEPISVSAFPSPRVILSFDVEEHHRIEAASGLTVPPSLRDEYARRMDYTTRRLLDLLACHGARATFFIVGQIARSNPSLVRAVHRAGHEVANHSWDHRRLHNHTPRSFRDDVRRANHALSQVTGAAIVGYRAPTFSLVRQTSWAVEVLDELGMLYDSSVFPVRHDRYGVPGAPRSPSLVRAGRGAVLEIPPATLRLLGANLPAGGGGYFRLFPLGVLEHAVRQSGRDCSPPVAMLYFHPWEFDEGQQRLPLGRVSRWRTYVGIRHTRRRLETLLTRHTFVPACEVAWALRPEDLNAERQLLAAV